MYSFKMSLLKQLILLRYKLNYLIVEFLKCKVINCSYILK